jgi:hypothetical protein
LPDRVVLVGFDPQSLMVSPIGVGHVDRQARMVVSEGPVVLQRLDFIGVSSVAANNDLLGRYVSGEIGLSQLIATMESAP